MKTSFVVSPHCVQSEVKNAAESRWIRGNMAAISKLPNIVLMILLTIVVAGFYTSSYGQLTEAKPNIVLIVADDQGWGDLSSNGNENLSTPNIDELGKEGASFSYFYVSPVCSPTRAELLTGRYHPRSGVYSTSAGGERMDLDETTIAEVFQRAGYATGIFGKWHNGMQYPYHPNGRGFQEFYGFASGHWGNYFSPRLLEHNGQLVQGEGYITNDFTDRVISFIEKYRDQPFFAYIPYNTPHSPMQVPDHWWNQLKNKELTMRHRNPQKEDPVFTKAALAMVENIDWNVGRITNRLGELKIAGDTIVLYLSDNGPNSWRWNGGMKGRKGDVDEGGVRSPLLIRWPGVIKPGQQIEQLAAAIDLLPTLADLADISDKTAKPLDGVSLKPLLIGQAGQWKERLIYSHWNGRTSVRSPRYRLGPQGGLYDMLKDPGQYHDISDQKKNITQMLADSLNRWEEQVNSQVDREHKRPFTLGYPGFKYTQLPARDGIPHGNIRRSNRYPNASFFTHWTSTSDSISWDVQVGASGEYKVDLYYTCPQEEAGSTIQLSFGSHSITNKLAEGYNPPLRGMEHDRVKRIESYVKDFKQMELGVIHLEKGRGTMTLKAPEMTGSQAMDFRLMMFKRVYL